MLSGKQLVLLATELTITSHDVACPAPILERTLESHDVMRSDMYKVIVERPRRSKDLKARALRFRNSLDGPSHLGMRVGYGYRELNENLAPLRRYLHSQVARPWNKVFGEICWRIDRRDPVQRHIHQHIGQLIVTQVEIRDGKLIEHRKF